jgi:hypothetical protein
MTDPERQRHALRSGYCGCVFLAIAAVILLVGGVDVPIGIAALVLDAAVLAALIYLRRSWAKSPNE